MTTLGARLASVAEGEVHISLPSRPEICQQNGYVHAGALTTILDSACGFAALSVAPDDCDVLTVEFKVNLLRPALADHFVAIGKVRKAGRMLTVCTAEILATQDGKDVSIALMQATIANLSKTR
ncbi:MULTISPECIES: PaaI family thioesterase [Lysobacteraceae]|nr:MULTISPECIES: PaaI family thioesterase [Lysobacter]